MSIAEQLSAVKNALLTIDGLTIGHYTASPQDGQPYCIWQEDQEGTSLSGDDLKVGRQLQGTIDLFSKAEFDPFCDAIEEALTNARIRFRLNSIQYEDETGYIHYEWVFYL